MYITQLNSTDLNIIINEYLNEYCNEFIKHGDYLINKNCNFRSEYPCVAWKKVEARVHYVGVLNYTFKNAESYEIKKAIDEDVTYMKSLISK